jgi:SAM-dependent methyltransferase
MLQTIARTPAPVGGLATAKRVTRAVLTNLLARIAPAAYVQLTGQTGRGSAAEEGAIDIARYFQDCVADYAAKLGAGGTRLETVVHGKVLLEYGPGDLPGVAALMCAHGAAKVWCVDRFQLLQLSPKNLRAMRDLIDAQAGVARDRLAACLRGGAVQQGFDPRRIEYLVRPSGLSGLHNAVDLVYSRAVLEHVDDLEATFADMVAAMRPGALAIHLVDLRSHGLHRLNPLDFLAWSPTLWNLMYSAKGVPNRWRVDRYRAIVERLPVEVLAFEPTRLAAAEDVASVRPKLASPFRTVSDDDLRWLGFWLLFRKRCA